MNTKVEKVTGDEIVFDNGWTLSSYHESDCCESHYLDIGSLSLADFEGLSFDLSSDAFFERVEDYGIRLIPINGHPVSIAGYGYNNGYYSSQLTLVLERGKDRKTFDITECQEVKD